MLNKKKLKCDSRKSNRRLYSYASNEPLTTAGEFETELCYKNKRCSVCFVVVEEKARAILSRVTSEKLAILKIEINTMGKEALLRDFPECFNGVGRLKGLQAKLHIDESAKPVAQKLRPPPYRLRDKIEQKLVDCDIIEPIEGPTPWVSPVVVVPKPSGDIRLCVDMRKANEAIVRERHLIPTVDDVLYQLNGSTMFSKLDLKWGFHQIELEQQSRAITTFITHKGLYRYKRLMFGISSAPELYQYTIQQAPAGCEGAYKMPGNGQHYTNSQKGTQTQKRELPSNLFNLCCLQSGGEYSFLVRSPHFKSKSVWLGKSSLAELLSCYHHWCLTRNSSKATDVIFFRSIKSI